MSGPTLQKALAPARAPSRRRVLRGTCACGKRDVDEERCDDCRRQAATADGASIDFADPRDDALEREADHVAEAETSLPADGPGSPPPLGTSPPRDPAPDDANGLPRRVRETVRAPGRPLDPATRRRIEPRLAADFSGVRVHTDGRAAESARDVSAHAYALGRHIVFAEGQYAPQTDHGRRLLVHELAHVMQQDGRTPILQRKPTPAPPAAAREIPSCTMVVSLSGILFEPETGATFKAGLTRPQLMAMVLQKLLGSRYDPGQRLEETILDEMQKRKPKEWPAFESGSALRADYVAEDGLAINRVRIEEQPAKILIDILLEKFGEVEMTPPQIELIRLGVASIDLFKQIKPKVPPWYTLEFFQREMSQHAGELRGYAESTSPQGQSEAADKALAAIIDPLNVMEAIRKDVSLAKPTHIERDTPSGKKKILVAIVYSKMWGEPKSSKAPERIASPEAVGLMLGYIRSQPVVSRRALEDHAARVMLLERFGEFLVRFTPQSYGDERLQDSPATANIEAFPSTLTSSPELQPPLFDVSLDSEPLFMMQLQFPTALDAFAGYTYYWEQVKVPDDQLPSTRRLFGAAKDEVLASEAETLKAGGKALTDAATNDKLKGQRVTSSDVWSRRVSRADRYAAEDIDRLDRESGGDPGIGAKTLVGANALLRYMGTGIKHWVEILTKNRDFGHDEQRVPFSEPGIYLVRVAAMPVLKGDEPLRRAPSVAFLPAFARDPQTMAESQVAMTAERESGDASRIAEIELELQAPVPPELRRQLEAELESLQAAEAGTGAKLALEKKRLEERKTQVEKEINEIAAGRQGGNVILLKNELIVLKEQIQLTEDRMKVRRKRSGDLEGAKPLTATFVADETGQVVPLALEIVDQGAKGDTYSVYLSDLTTPKSGADHGEGIDKRAAIRKALDKVLSSGQGYGRGYVSFVLDDRVESVRITSTLGNLLAEAVDNIALAISAAALAAAPFTGGASLSILVPVGIVGGVPAGYRLLERSRTGTLTLDLATAMDVVSVAGAALGLSRLAVATRVSGVVNPSLRAIRVSKGLMIFGLGVHGLNAMLLGASVIEQLEALDKEPNLSDSERRAKMMLIFGNVMIQAGMEIGERLASHGHSMESMKPGPETVREPTVPDKVAKPTKEGGAVVDPQAPAKTMAGTKPGGDLPRSPNERATLIRDVGSKEALFERLGREGIRREGTDEPRAQTTIVANQPRTGIRDVHEAYRLYDEALRAGGGKVEVAIYRNLETGEYAVSVGDETRVSAPEGRYEGVLHYHPNPHAAKQFRLPAPADFEGPMRRFVATGHTAREFLEYEIPGVGRGRTEFGILQGEEKPFYVTVYLPDGSASTMRFAHDGTYAAYWSGEKTFVDPDSPLHKAMIADIHDYLKAIEAPREPAAARAEAPGPETRTAAGAGRPRKASLREPAKFLMGDHGELTEEGVTFLRKKFGKRFKNMKDAEVRDEFEKNDKGGRLLEAVGVEDIKRHWKESRPGKAGMLFARPKNFGQVFTKLAKRMGLRSVNPELSVLEFVRTNMGNELAFMERHPDPEVRARWTEFAWGARQGGKKGAGWLLYRVSNTAPDVVEVFFDRKLAIVTDLTYRTNDPIHNFKTLYYALVMEQMTGFEAGAVDYRHLFSQRVADRQDFAPTP